MVLSPNTALNGLDPVDQVTKELCNQFADEYVSQKN